MMTPMVQCPPPKELQAYIRGQLSGEESDALVVHVASCAACQSQLETVSDAEDSLIASLRTAADDDDYALESGYPEAMAQALAALATARSTAAVEGMTELPEVIGEYEIVRPLGRGGMGSVYLARHTKLNREVALKVLAHHRAASRRIRERFEVEMQAVGRLSHPNIVAAHDARDVDGTAVLITEFIDGFDLGQLLDRVGPLSVEHACEIGRQVALALAYTSSQGFVHRDVKPSNIMLSRRGEVKLLDLGLARLQWDEHDQREMTGTGEAMGTADYMAPEQVSDSRSVDVRADIYALGCTLFKLLTGVAPFSREETAFAKMTSHVSASPPSVAEYCPQAPSALVQLVETMLEKDVEQRPQHPSDVADALKRMGNSPGGQEMAASLADLVAQARRAELGASPSLPPTAMVAQERAQPRLQSRLPVGWLVASGFASLCCGFFLGVFVTITYPDGTVAKLMLPAGAKLEIRLEGDESGGKGGSMAGSAGKPALADGSEAKEGTVADEDFVHFKLKYVSSLWMKLQLMDFFQEEQKKNPAAPGQKKMKFVDDGESILVVRHATPSRLETIRRLLAIYDTPEKEPRRKPSTPRPKPSDAEPGEANSVVLRPASVREVRVESRPPLQLVVLHQDLAGAGPFPDPRDMVDGLSKPDATTRWLLLAPNVPRPAVSVSTGDLVFLPTLWGPDEVIRWEEISGHTGAMTRGGIRGTTFTFDEGLTSRINQLLTKHPEHHLCVVFNGAIVAILESKGEFRGQLTITHRMTDEELRYLMGSLSGELVEQLPERKSLPVNAEPQEEEDLSAVSRKLRGRWQAVAIVDPASTGDKTAGTPPLQFSFKGNDYLILQGKEVRDAGTFSLRLARGVLAIDMQRSGGSGEETRRGILRFNERLQEMQVDQLELHFRDDKRRPAGFDQPGNAIVTLQRIATDVGHDSLVAEPTGEDEQPNDVP